MNAKVLMVIRILFGLFLLAMGLNKFLDFMPPVELSGDAATYMMAIMGIVQIKQKYPNDIYVFTQNIDDMFEKAGIKKNEIIHLHGYLLEIRCRKCEKLYEIGYQKQDDFLDDCISCGGKLRPHIVFFGENAPMYEVLNYELNTCDLIVVIGTSSNVLDVTYFAQLVDKSILNNLEPSDAIDDTYFTKVIYAPATQAIAEITEYIEYFIENN